MSVDERLLYSMHECVGGHALRLHDAEDRFRAAAHTYDPDVISGQRMKGVMHKLFTVHDPSTDGSYREASAAFLRCHQEVEVRSRASNPNPGPQALSPTLTPALTPTLTLTQVLSRTTESKATSSFLQSESCFYDHGKGSWYHKAKEYRPRPGELTKCKRLVADLVALQAEEPDFHAVVFTQYDEMQRTLVEAVKTASRSGGELSAGGKAPALRIFEFNKKTAPTTRHKRIAEFQNSSAPGGRVFIFTVATAAVGITLTAATRVYLMEPMADPAQEVQAAGRIHRLGQTQDIFIRRYCFRDSIEEAVCAMHEQIRRGAFRVLDGKFPPEADELFQRYGPAASLFRRRGEAQGKSLQGEGLLDWGGALKRPAAKDARGKLVRLQPSRWTRACTEQECKLCGIRRIEPGSSVWHGTGTFSYLQGDTRDPPRAGTGVGAFREVPAPPATWQPERFKAAIELINTTAERAKEEKRLAELAVQRGAVADGATSGGAIALDDSDDEAAVEGGAAAAGAAGAESEEEEEEDVDFACESLEDATAGETDELTSDDEAVQALEDSQLHGMPWHYGGPRLLYDLGGDHSLSDPEGNPRMLRQELADIFAIDCDSDDSFASFEMEEAEQVEHQAGDAGDEGDDEFEDEAAEEEAVLYATFLMDFEETNETELRASGVADEYYRGAQ